MSSLAVGWALGQQLPAATKVVLWGYAEHANPDGKNSWISATTAAKYAGVSKGTAIRHIQTLIELGYLRFGDQSNIDGKIPLNRRPVLYDLAMSDETRQQWAAEYDPAVDPRLVSKAGGVKGGLASTTKRQGLQNPTPQIEGQGLQKTDSGVATTKVQGLQPCNPNQVLKPTTEPTTGDYVEPTMLTLVSINEQPKPQKRKPAAHCLPADWKPTTTHAEFAAEKGIDLPTEVMAFKAHAEANDRRQVRWDAAFTQWLINERKFSRGRPQQSLPVKVSEWRPAPFADEQMAAAAAERATAGAPVTPEERARIKAELGIVDPRKTRRNEWSAG